MASTYSTNLGIELIGTGDQSGTWGATTNTNFGTLVEQAIVGYSTQAVTDSGTATVLTIANGASSTGRNYVVELTGTLTTDRTVTVPAVNKPYVFYNNTVGGFSVTVKVSGQTGVTIKNGRKAIVYTNTIDVIEIANSPVTQDGTLTLTNKTLTTPVINGFSGDTSAITIGTSQFVKDTSGNVGIGVTSPGAKLDVAGTIWSRPGNAAGAVAILTADATSGTTGISLSASFASGGYGPIKFVTSGTEQMRLDASGNLLVGNTASLSSERLLVRAVALGGTAGNTSYNSVFYTPDTTNTTRLSVLDYRVSNGTDHTTSRNKLQRRVDSTDMGYVGFDSTGTSIGWQNSEAMRFDNAGNAGIGTSTSAGNALRYLDLQNSDTGSSAGSIMRFITSNVAASGLTTVDVVKYKTGGFYINNNETNTAAFTAFNVGSSERLRIDSSGNVGIGTASPAYKLHVYGGSGASVVCSSATAGQVAYVSVAGNGNTFGSTSFDMIQNDTSTFLYNRANTPMIFGVNNAEAMRIDSGGNLLVGYAYAYGRISSYQNGANTGVRSDMGTGATGGVYAYLANLNRSDQNFILFQYIGSTIGFISNNTTSVTYNTSSDYRLKNDVQPMLRGLETVSALKPVTYKWKLDGSYGEGFVAHELQEIIPLAVHGEKDAVDKDGKIKSQGVDYSKIVVHLVAAIQELSAKNDALEARLAKLETVQ